MGRPRDITAEELYQRLMSDPAIAQVIEQSEKAYGTDAIERYVEELLRANKSARRKSRPGGKSSEASTHGFGKLDDAAAKRHYDELSVGALHRLGLSQAKVQY